ncbi:MAG: bifunctional alpha/beta hydrolase/OsmC family protein [Gammaproteobacteria bacterium]|nr:bifunctional alpha/beta hydrolase/OsmC family protein [Gammaproteobacteria bacterium]
MSRQKLEFPNESGEILAGALELPDRGEPAAFALFAHCFTCGKDIAAASRIARALTDHGIAVLRFDFTGLGNSDGDFSNTNFSSNVADLVAAANFLRDHYRAPALLIGHSLGGAAVLAAAHQLPETKAVATISAPATARHVAHLFSDSTNIIKSEGSAKVSLGQRQFTIKSQLIDDLERFTDTAHIGRLRRPLLIFHSPLDNLVSIDEAAKIYAAAKHPKSFISLDQADHLLSNKQDSRYVAETLAAWAGRYVSLEQPLTRQRRPDLEAGEVLVTEENKQFLRRLYTPDHELPADEPEKNGGTAKGPDPYELLLMSLGACTSMTLRMYANHKKLPVEDIQVRLKHERVHARDCAECESSDGYVARIDRVVSYTGELTGEQHQRFLAIADKCPVHKTLEGEIRVVTRSA